MVLNVDCEADPSNITFDVYPNPNNGNFTIKISNEKNIQKQGHLHVFNTLGAPVYQTGISLKSGINLFSVNEDLTKGFYLIRLEMDGALFTPKRFIVD